MTTSLAVGGARSLHIPDGVPAARVVSVRPDPMNPSCQEVRAVPHVNLTRLEYVEVLTYEEAGGE